MTAQPHRLFTKRQLAILILVVLVSFAFIKWQAAIKHNRTISDEPFQIGDNLYYVGHTGVTAFLLTGPDGHVLIDGGYPEHGPLIIESIDKLGFDIRDVRILLNSHAHSDHAGGLHDLQEASGAELWVSEGDAGVMAAGGRGDKALGPMRYTWYAGLLRFPAPRVDRTFADGDTIRVGPIELTAHITAGHTRGCTSWSFPITDGDRTLFAVSICSLKLFPFVSLDSKAYPTLRGDFEKSFETLRNLPVDVFLASHSGWFNLHQKQRKQGSATSLITPFIDPEGYHSFIDAAEEAFDKRKSDG